MILDWAISFEVTRCLASVARNQAEDALQYERYRRVAQEASDAAQHEKDLAEARLGKVIDGEFVDVTNERLLAKD